MSGPEQVSGSGMGRRSLKSAAVLGAGLAAGMAALAALLATGCGPGDSSAPDAPRPAMTRVLDGVAAGVPGQRIGDVMWYEPENLYEYIDGMAGYYVDSGFLLLAHSEWRGRDAKEGAYVELDIYDMGSPAGALDILADARTPQTRYVALGNEAHETDDGMDLRVGGYYVKVVARRDIAGQRDFIKALALAVAQATPAGPSDEALVAPLPAAGMAPHTAAYSTKGFLGRDCLNKVREAAYEVRGKRVRLFVIDAGDADKAKAMLAEWKDSVPPQPIGAQALPNSLSYNEDYVGTVAATVQGKWLAGAIGEAAVARPLLASLLKRLQ
jgi:hypothetical protein